MSAYSSHTGTAMAGSWPMARVMAGMSAVPVTHAIDLAFFFPADAPVRHDALIAETRRHLGGCIAAVEMALRLSMDYAPDVTAALDRCAEPLAWPMVRAQPSLLAPGLLAHMQMRAGVTLMLRPFGQADIEQAEEADGPLPTSDHPELGDAVSALALAEGRWLMPGGEAQPMRPDLPAEHFAELVWTVAACLATAAQRMMADGADGVPAAFERAVWKLLADHDEGAGPIAQADRLVRQMGDAADAPDLPGKALGQRRFLLFVALAARRLRMDSVQVTDMLLLGPPSDVALLCRALGGSDGDYRHLLMALRPVRPTLTDIAIVTEADRYQAMSDPQVEAAVQALRTPATFRAKLDHLRAVCAA
jgi:hypothetical protein